LDKCLWRRVVMEKGAIMLLDVLGWNGIWQRKKNPHESLKELIKGIDYAVGYYRESKDEKDREFIQSVKIEYRSISDTIAVIVYGEPTRAIELQSLISCLLVTKSISEGIPLRGAISYGDLFLSDNILVGPSIDEVASWYESSESIGVFLTPSALFQYNPDTAVYKEFILVKDDIFIKDFGIFKTFSANWPRMWESDTEMKSARKNELMKCFLRMGPITPAIAKKYMNSLAFFELHNIEKQTVVESEVAAAKESDNSSSKDGKAP
jgi:hypothetical protein